MLHQESPLPAHSYPSYLPSFLFASLSWIVPPIAPSALKFFPMAPSLSRGPPIFWAMPPIGPSAVVGIESVGELFRRGRGGERGISKKLTVEHGADGTVFREDACARSGGFVAGGGLEGGKRVRLACLWLEREEGAGGRRWRDENGKKKRTYALMGGLVDAVRQIHAGDLCAIGTCVEGFGGLVAVHGLSGRVCGFYVVEFVLGELGKPMEVWLIMSRRMVIEKKVPHVGTGGV
ncbi:MAG: hypothetical protein Q9187_002727 [Circinaria calcarea]